MLSHLRFAHVMVPLLHMMSFISLSGKKKFFSMAKLFDSLSIFIFQATIFYAQCYQMESDAILLEGYNLWFTIEIITFYGYITAAILYIFESTIMSNLGFLDKEPLKDRYKYDFIHYHDMDLQWYSFIMILIMVNGFIVYFNIKRTDSQTNYMVRYGPLHLPMQLLLFLHII